MLNIDRVQHMTSMALYEKKESKNIMMAVRYTRRDYLTVCMLSGFLSCTILYGILYFGALVILLSTVIRNVNTLAVILMIILGLILYLSILYLHLLHVKREANQRYTEDKEKLKKLQQAYRILDEMYEQE